LTAKRKANNQKTRLVARAQVIGGNYAKFWLEHIDLAKSVGYKEMELNEIQEIILRNVEFLKKKWDAYFNFKRI